MNAGKRLIVQAIARTQREFEAPEEFWPRKGGLGYVPMGVIREQARKNLDELGRVYQRESS